jgi:hypothetical protein
MSPSRLVLVLLFAFISHLAVAQQTASPPASQSPQRDLQAIAILQRSAQLLRSTAAPISSTSQNGILVSGTYHVLSGLTSPDFAVRAKILSSTQVRWEFDQPDGMVSTVVSSGVGWRTGPSGTVGLPLGDMMGRQLEALPFLAISDWLSDPNVAVKDIGPQTIEGVQLHLVTLAYPYRLEPSGTLTSIYQTVGTCDLYFDSTTNLPARMRFKQYPRDIRVGVPVELIFSDYKLVSGFQVPTTVGYSVYGQLVGEYHFDSVALNTPISPSDFEAN